MFAKLVVVLCAVYIPLMCSSQATTTDPFVSECFPHTTKLVRFYHLCNSEDCDVCLFCYYFQINHVTVILSSLILDSPPFSRHSRQLNSFSWILSALSPDSISSPARFCLSYRCSTTSTNSSTNSLFTF